MKINWDEKAKNEGIRIKHFRNGKGLIGTLVYRIPLYETAHTSYGMTIVSKKDAPTREKGREVAYGRLLRAENLSPEERKVASKKRLQNHRVERKVKTKLYKYEYNVPLERVKEVIVAFRNPKKATNEQNPNN